MSPILKKVKEFYDIWKMWLFFSALLVGTNGAQLYSNHEPELDQHIPADIEKHGKPAKIIKQIIYKTDNFYCDKQIDAAIKKHLNSSSH